MSPSASLIIAEVPAAPVVLGLNEWLAVALATAIIFGILGPKLLREWRA